MTCVSVVVPVVDILRTPNGPRDRQAVMGEAGTVLSSQAAWSEVRMEKDGYQGFVPSGAISEAYIPTHKVSARSCHGYRDPDFKSPEQISLSFGSRLLVEHTDGKFAKTSLGYVPLQHLSSLDVLESNSIDVARKFLGTPYLWGGNSGWGIDCSGLVQAAMVACGHPCEGDSGPQSRTLGKDVSGQSYLSGDILFWKGHVGLISGPDSLIHANAYHMMVVEEPLQAAIVRIQENGDGPVTGHRRI